MSVCVAYFWYLLVLCWLSASYKPTYIQAIVCFLTILHMAKSRLYNLIFSKNTVMQLSKMFQVSYFCCLKIS